MDEAKAGDTLEFITGKGLNSDPMKGPVLMPALKKLCQDQRWSVEELDGSFRINVPDDNENLSQSEEHVGLVAGDIISEEIWGCLRNTEGKVRKFSRMRKAICDYAVVFVDPRRSSAQTMDVIKEFKMIPQEELSISLSIITPDDSSEHRKLIKKLKSDWCVMLSDPEKKFIEAVRCHAVQKLLSVLLILDAKTGSILGIWYEGCVEWETDTLSDFVTETIQHLQDQE